MEPNKVDIRVALTIGLIAFALLHAVSLTTAQRIAPHIEQALFDSPSTAAPNPPRGGINFDDSRNSGGVVNTLPVNSSARDEVKRQLPIGQTQAADCLPCINGQSRPLIATPINPSIQPITQPMVAKPTTPRYSIELFVIHNDPASQQLLGWFNSDATLQKWRKGVNFNVYTRDNRTYLTRFANKIPDTSFPCVLVTDPNGGSVYFCDRGTMPKNTTELTTIIAEKKKIQADTLARQDAVQNDGSQPDSGRDTLLDAIVGGPDCVDGVCKPKPFWQSDPPTDSVQGILRMIFRPGETIFLIVIILAAVVTIVFFIKRGRS